MTINDIIDENFGFLLRNNHIFLDFPAGTPISDSSLECLSNSYKGYFANPSSNNLEGELASNKLKKSRIELLDLLKLDSHQITFTSGSTESINLGLRGFYMANNSNGNRIITSKLEHKAVLNTCDHLESLGADVRYVKTTSEGAIDLDHLQSLIDENTILISIMHVNNETGVINPIHEIQELIKTHQAKLFSDTTQSIGKIPFDFNSIDMFCFSAHKLHGPKGVGGLIVKKDTTIVPITYGGSQEAGQRPGTVNLPSILASITAVNESITHIRQNFDIAKLRQRKFESEVIQNSAGKVNCYSQVRSPYISNICLNETTALDFMMINRNKYSLSSGSACNDSVVQPSHVLTEIYGQKIEVENSIRIGLPTFGLNTLTR